MVVACLTLLATVAALSLTYCGLQSSDVHVMRVNQPAA
jgi:hypothetical protein